VAAISTGSVLLPLALGAVLAVAMYPTLAPPGVGRTPFVLFIAVALSITAFPVLARVLADRGLETSYLGSLALACAAVNDVIAWCLLTAAIALAAAVTALTTVAVIALTAALAASLILCRPLLRRLLEGAARHGDELVLVILCAGFCLTAYATDRIGIHPAFGAFLFGAVTPRDIPAIERSTARLRTIFLPVLLPLYFADTGLHTNLIELRSGQWGWALAILAAAVAGKWCGAATAARLTGSTWRFAAAIGVLMNCRGVTELVVLGIGRQIGVITPQLFALLVLMAIVTTGITSPLLSRLHPGPQTNPDPERQPPLAGIDGHPRSTEQTR
jgi:Kef-type K+ transport system membrane component KefB